MYAENWEKGRLDTSQWGAQCNNLTPPYVGTRGTFRVQRKIIGQGRWAARFDLPPDTTKATACEILHNRTLDLGRGDYYALAVFFPRTWKEPARAFWGMAIAQFNYEGITGPPVGLYAHGHYVNLTIQSGFFDGYATRWHSGNGIARGNLAAHVRDSIATQAWILAPANRPCPLEHWKRRCGRRVAPSAE